MAEKTEYYVTPEGKETRFKDKAEYDKHMSNVARLQEMNKRAKERPFSEDNGPLMPPAVVNIDWTGKGMNKKTVGQSDLDNYKSEKARLGSEALDAALSLGQKQGSYKSDQARIRSQGVNERKGLREKLKEARAGITKGSMFDTTYPGILPYLIKKGDGVDFKPFFKKGIKDARNYGLSLAIGDDAQETSYGQEARNAYKVISAKDEADRTRAEQLFMQYWEMPGKIEASKDRQKAGLEDLREDLNNAKAAAKVTQENLDKLVRAFSKGDRKVKVETGPNSILVRVSGGGASVAYILQVHRDPNDPEGRILKGYNAIKDPGTGEYIKESNTDIGSGYPYKASEGMDGALSDWITAAKNNLRKIDAENSKWETDAEGNKRRVSGAALRWRTELGNLTKADAQALNGKTIPEYIAMRALGKLMSTKPGKEAEDGTVAVISPAKAVKDLMGMGVMIDKNTGKLFYSDEPSTKLPAGFDPMVNPDLAGQRAERIKSQGDKINSAYNSAIAKSQEAEDLTERAANETDIDKITKLTERALKLQLESEKRLSNFEVKVGDDGTLKVIKKLKPQNFRSVTQIGASRGKKRSGGTILENLNTGTKKQTKAASYGQGEKKEKKESGSAHKISKSVLDAFLNGV